MVFGYPISPCESRGFLNLKTYNYNMGNRAKSQTSILLIARGATCCYCKKRLNMETFSREHVVPKAYGGSNHPVNKKPCCKDCNTKRRAWPLEEYKKLLTRKLKTLPIGCSYEKKLITEIEGVCELIKYRATMKEKLFSSENLYRYNKHLY